MLKPTFWSLRHSYLNSEKLAISGTVHKVREVPIRLLLCFVMLAGCELLGVENSPRVPSPERAPVRAEPVLVDEPAPEPELLQPLTFWEYGSPGGEIEGETAARDGYLALDLGEGWAPYLFTDRPGMPNAYRPTYLSLARGEFPDDHHGDRARRDEYLELYGIMPTLGLLRQRLAERSSLVCADELDLAPLEAFDGFVAYRNNDRARRDARQFIRAEREVPQLVEEAGVEDASDLDADTLSRRARGFLSSYLERRAEVAAIRATQARLECEGFFGDTRFTHGAMDWSTHEALARFERRHRIYGWGFIGRDTIDALRAPVVANEREDVIRVLVERAMHALGVIEDGSGSMVRDGEPRTFRDARAEAQPLPNFEAQLRELVIESFGLQTPESTLAFLERLHDEGRFEREGHYAVALRAPTLPAYYGPEMELELETDRGDVWYEFPYDENGRERPQPVQRRPRLTVYVTYEGQRIAIARFGTTIGGWRSERVDGTVMWKYKQSEVGPRVISRIVASPVWLPPEGTPVRSLLHRNREGRGADRYGVNYHETGPSYASAYGLVAAYHQKFAERADGTVRVGGDEGIRTHGSVDYMSIMRRHSHGCHRLHNHIAVRLMSFILRHRPHRREGQQSLSFRRELEHDGNVYRMVIDQGGYVFRLAEPLRVTVLEGRVRGARQTPILDALPKYDEEVGAYVMPDGQTVSVDRLGTITPITLPDAGPDGAVLDGSVPDAGVEAGVNVATNETGGEESSAASASSAENGSLR